MCQLQLDDNTVGQLLTAKETNHKPTDAYTMAQGVEHHRLSQQRDQLAICDCLLCQYFMHPNQDQSWLQLVAPKQIRPLILEELHQEIGSGHLRQEKILGRLKNDSIGQVTLVMYTIGVSPASAVLLGRPPTLADTLHLGLLVLGIPCRSLLLT